MRLPRVMSGRSGVCAGAFLAATAVALLAGPALAQSNGATGSLERFQPATPGDAMFGVGSPAIGGHLVPRAAVIFDYAYQPLSIQDGDTRHIIVSDQLFLHAAASFSLWDRLLVSADMPFAIAQGGDNPTVADVAFASPAGAQVGDLRLGARVRFFGDFWDPFQIGAGGYIYVPTAPADSYAGDGAVRGEPHLLVGGRSDHFVYSAQLGTTLHGSGRPHTFDARAGAAVVVGDDALFQIGPELSIAAPLSEDVIVDNPDTKITVASPVAAELLLGAKLRVLKSLVFGVGAGPGLTQGYGTPVFFGVGSIAYDPLPPRTRDSDRDGIFDADDACPKVAGVRNDDPKKHGCPPDTDGDGIFDADDACPKVPGVRSDDPKKHGCPLDTDGDGDGILDTVDACPTVPGVRNDDPKKHGCPLDSDGDGIFDAQDACPTVPGVRDDDPKKNGCPPDGDNDGIPDAVDACPTVRGGPDPDPKKNGCPHVTVTPTEIVIQSQVKFKFGRSSLDQTVDPVSEDMLTEVRNAIQDHPEIELIEVQGHADIVGPDDYNQTLSEARANAVRNWLVKKGIPGEKLVAKGYGSRAPIAPNDSEQGRQENRRAQFVIIKKKAAP